MSGVRWSLLGRIGTRVVALLVSIVLAHLLAIEDFGVVAMAIVVTELMHLLADLGTGYALVNDEDVEDDLVASVHTINLVLGTAIVAAVVMFAEHVAWLFDEPRLTAVLQVLAGTTLIGAWAVVHRALLMRSMRFDRIAHATLLGAIAQALVAIPCAASGLGIWSLVAGTYANVVVTTAWIRLGSRCSVHGRFSWSQLRGIAKFSINQSAYSLYAFFAMWSDQIILGRFLGAGPLGIYSMAQRLTSKNIRQLAAAADPVLFSHLARSKGREQTERDYVRAVASVSLVFVPIAIGAGVVAEPLVAALLTPQWYTVAPLIAIMSPAAAITVVIARGESLYRASGRTDLLLLWGVMCGTVEIAAYLIGLRWGLLGVVIAHACALALLAIPGTWIPFRLVGVRYRTLFRALLPGLVATAIMAAATASMMTWLHSLDLGAWIVLAGAVVTGIASYALMLALLKPPELADVLKRPNFATVPVDE